MDRLLRIFALGTVCLGLTLVSTIVKAELPTLAAIPLKAKRVPVETVAILDELLVNTLHQLGMYQVIGRGDIVAMLEIEQQKELLTGCDDDSCFAQIGAALGARFMVTGSVSQLGDQLIISLTMLEPMTQKVHRRITSQVKRDERLYLAAIVKTIHDFVSVSISAEEWETYLIYRSRAVGAKLSPAGVDVWKATLFDANADWLEFFDYYRDETLKGSENLMDFKQWYEASRLGSLSIESTPPGARITIDGEDFGISPKVIGGLSPGSTKVILELEGHAPGHRIVEVNAAETIQLGIPLLTLEEIGVIENAREAILLRGLIAAGVGTALAGGGLALLLGQRSLQDIEDNEYQAYLQQQDTKAAEAYAPVAAAFQERDLMGGFGIGLLAAGAMAAVYAGYELFTLPSTETALTPRLFDDVFSLHLSGRF